MLRAHLAPGASYLNVGHANLSPAVLAALKAVPGLRIAVLIHDTIPLDHPEYQRPDQPARFEALLRATGAFADLVICNSAFTESRARHHLARLGPVPETMVAHLGLDLGLAAPGALPAGVDPAHPRFVVLGTIEPRKNHRLLLEIWARLGSDPDRVPHLHIVGRRGWMNAEVFRILDTAPFMGRTVFEHPALPDAQVAALLRGARGLLFPSHAEGFGLPPLEAAALGVPVICATHPIYSEILGDYPLYLNNADSYSWETAIKAWAGWGNSGNESAARPTGSLPLPAWEAHFARVLARV
jgi:glycosyltransferase involved in cell wall biosynthesis